MAIFTIQAPQFYAEELERTWVWAYKRHRLLHVHSSQIYHHQASYLCNAGTFCEFTFANAVKGHHNIVYVTTNIGEKDFLLTKFWLYGIRLYYYTSYNTIPDLSSIIQTSCCKKISIPRKNTTFYMASVSIEGTDDETIQIPDLKEIKDVHYHCSYTCTCM